MQIAHEGDLPHSSDFDQIGQLLPLAHTRLLELGCGDATTTRQLAEHYPVREIIAMEVDQIQHEKNLQIDDLSKVTFCYGGAQQIDLPDASVDAVIMLKSLHHVPVEEMDAALREIARVLQPGGLAYISEPVYASDFNDILRLFHDEKVVREAAFAAIQRAIGAGWFRLEREIHFANRRDYHGFEEFEKLIMGVTHSEFDINPALHAKIKSRFLSHVDANGTASFLHPLRIDLLRKE